MGVAYTGTRGEPVVASSGNTPTFAADLTDISAFFAARSLRRFTTAALLLASTGSTVGDAAVANNAPGAIFVHTGSGWFMHGLPRFADAAARDAALTAPVAGWRAVTADNGIEWVYSGSAWVEVKAAARVVRSATALNLTASSWDQSISGSSYWTEDYRQGGIAAYSNGWTIPEAGIWRVSFGIALANAGSCGLTVNDASVANFADFIAHASAPQVQSVAMMNGSVDLDLAATDVLRLFAVSAAGTIAWNTTPGLSWFGIEKLS